MGSPGYLIPPDTQQPLQGQSPPQVPTAAPPPQGGGFLDTLLGVIKNLKIGVGPKSMIRSGEVPGMSWNDLTAPMRQATERKQLFDTYLNLGEQSGMDTTQFKQIKFGPFGPSPDILHAVGAHVENQLRYGQRRPLGDAFAAQMIPQPPSRRVWLLWY